ncbi:hypothetical protein SAMN04488556_3310 [Halostagnicola kamekurae]|uniref:Uncharacterized protein n=1 Tax=Halostagnicola kamekurae TaxID=619731 RepID=A0A1I6TQ99_9EURY|nr:hypothetical protein SAMN04488556_3310 [Halostagnicola kamekurae]
MLSNVKESLFTEPSGRHHAALMFGSTLVFSGLLVYSKIVGGSSSGRWLFFMIAGTALSGIAESLPTDQRRTAGILRITGIFVLSSLLIFLAVSPEFVIGQ